MTPRGAMIAAIIELAVAAVFVVASVLLLSIGSRGGIVTLILAIVSLIAGCLALWAYSTMRHAAADADHDQ